MVIRKITVSPKNKIKIHFLEIPETNGTLVILSVPNKNYPEKGNEKYLQNKISDNTSCRSLVLYNITCNIFY